jgi:hypothetical protein
VKEMDDKPMDRLRFQGSKASAEFQRILTISL